MNNVLTIAGYYNILWGTIVVMFPNIFFQLADLPVPLYPMIWQSVGMIVGVYGIGYWLAARNPIKHYPIVVVGFLGKLFGPIGIFYYVFTGMLSPNFIYVTVFNDLIWIYPFGALLLKAWKVNKFKH